MTRRIDWFALLSAFLMSTIFHGLLYGLHLSWQATASAAICMWLYCRLTEPTR